MHHVILSATIALALNACANAAASDDSTVTVFAAASLTDAFNELKQDFEKANPGVTVRLSFAGSQTLRTQIENGAKPDVFASANDKQMSALAAKRLVTSPVKFAHNELVVVTPKRNPAGIRTFQDLPQAKRLVIAGPMVPAGAYAERLLRNSRSHFGPDFDKRVMSKVVSRELSVRQALQKVMLGEADAALVYRTDANAAADKVSVIDVPAGINVKADYPIALVGKRPRKPAAKRFISFVLSQQGSQRLSAHGFVRANVAQNEQPQQLHTAAPM